MAKAKPIKTELSQSIVDLVIASTNRLLIHGLELRRITTNQPRKDGLAVHMSQNSSFWSGGYLADPIITLGSGILVSNLERIMLSWSPKKDLLLSDPAAIDRAGKVTADHIHFRVLYEIVQKVWLINGHLSDTITRFILATIEELAKSHLRPTISIFRLGIALQIGPDFKIEFLVDRHKSELCIKLLPKDGKQVEDKQSIIGCIHRYNLRNWDSRDTAYKAVKQVVGPTLSEVVLPDHKSLPHHYRLPE